MPSPYYSPGDYGLELVDDLDDPGGWDFHIVAVWRDGDGRHYWASDSGCSCPVPFEDYRRVEDLVPLTGSTVSGLRRAARGVPGHSDHDADRWLVRLLSDVIGSLDDEAAVPFLKSHDPTVRRLALQALGRA